MIVCVCGGVMEHIWSFFFGFVLLAVEKLWACWLFFSVGDCVLIITMMVLLLTNWCQL